MENRALFWMKIYFINKFLKDESDIEWIIYFDCDILYNRKSDLELSDFLDSNYDLII
jgi:hypothetical protein